VWRRNFYNLPPVRIFGISVTPSMGVLFPNLRRGIVSTLQSFESKYNARYHRCDDGCVLHRGTLAELYAYNW
jgi:hypothetical protein